MHKLSIVGKGYHTDEQVVGYYNTGDRHEILGQGWCILGRLLGTLVRIRDVRDPGARPNFSGWASGGWIVAGLEGAVRVGALGALGAGLFSIGIPQRQHCEVPDGAHDRSVSPDRSWHSCRSGQGEGDHREHESCPLPHCIPQNQWPRSTPEPQKCGSHLKRGKNHDCR